MKTWRKFCQLFNSRHAKISATRWNFFELINNRHGSSIREQRVSDKNPAKYPWITPPYGGTTPLHEAARCGHTDICRLILVNVDDKNPKKEFGITPLHEAAKQGHTDICRLIIASVQVKNPEGQHGNTPLHTAARYGHTDICRLIIDSVENKNPGNEYGITPLHLAAGEGHETICRLIIDRVEEKNPEDSDGVTPLQEAERRGHTDISALIRQYFNPLTFNIYLMSDNTFNLFNISLYWLRQRVEL